MSWPSECQLATLYRAMTSEPVDPKTIPDDYVPWEYGQLLIAVIENQDLDENQVKEAQKALDDQQVGKGFKERLRIKLQGQMLFKTLREQPETKFPKFTDNPQQLTRALTRNTNLLYSANSEDAQGRW